MIYYLSRRLIMFTLLIFFVSALVLAFDIKFRSDLYFILSSYIFMIPMGVFKPNWLLLLPYSRKKLYLLHVLEITLLYLVVLFSYWCMGYIRHKLYEKALPLSSLSENCFFLLLLICLISIKSSFPLKAEPKTTMEDLFSIKGIIRFKKTFLGFAAFSLFFLFDQQIWYLLSLIVLIVTSMPYAGLSMMLLPRKSLAKARFANIVFTISALAGLWGFMYYNLSSKKPLDSSISFWGNLNPKISSARAKEILSYTHISASAYALKLARNSQSQFSTEEWENRTNKCKTKDCFDISSSLIPSTSPLPEQLSMFEKTMRKCAPAFKGQSINCTGPYPQTTIATWIAKLISEGQVNSWLESNDNLKQFIAIRALTHSGATTEQIKIITSLEKSGHEITRAAAQLYAISRKIIDNCKKEPCKKVIPLKDLF